MKRIIGIDIIKTCAVFFVISVHFFLHTNYYGQPLTPGENLFFQTVLRWFFLICVPLFLITTGYLQRNKTLSRRYYKGLVPVIGVYLFYSVITLLVRHFYYGEKQNTIKWAYDVISFNAIPYAWYVRMYIGLFLLIPFLNLIFSNLKNKKEHIALIVTLIVMRGIPGFINHMPITLKGSSILYMPDWWVGLYPLAYYFIGCYVREYQPKIKKYFFVLMILVALITQAGLTYYFSQGGPFTQVLGEYDSVMVMMTATLFFLLFYNIKFKNKIISRSLSTISELTLDIYLFSFLVDRAVYQYVFAHIFKSNYQIIYYFIPIVGTVIIISVLVSILRKMLTDLLAQLFRRVT